MQVHPLSNLKKVRTIRSATGMTIEIYSAADWQVVDVASKPNIFDLIAAHMGPITMALLVATLVVATYFGS